VRVVTATFSWSKMLLHANGYRFIAQGLIELAGADVVPEDV
jgi:hypothetical protein